MKKIFAISAFAMILTFTFMDTAFAGRIKNRQVRQQDRIYQGVRSGELSRYETRRLERQQVRIQKAKAGAWQDGTMTRRERVKLEAMQDIAGRSIYRAKHNDK